MEVLREVAILRRLSHPNVIQLQGAYRREKTELVVRISLCGTQCFTTDFDTHYTISDLGASL